MIKIEVPYGTYLCIPNELAGFLPSMFTIDSEGYGPERKLFRVERQIQFEVVEPASILPERPAMLPVEVPPTVDLPIAPPPSAIDEDDLPF